MLPRYVNLISNWENTKLYWKVLISFVKTSENLRDCMHYKAHSFVRIQVHALYHTHVRTQEYTDAQEATCIGKITQSHLRWWYTHINMKIIYSNARTHIRTRDLKMKQQHTWCIFTTQVIIDTILAKTYKSMTEDDRTRNKTAAWTIITSYFVLLRIFGAILCDILDILPFSWVFRYIQFERSIFFCQNKKKKKITCFPVSNFWRLKKVNIDFYTLSSNSKKCLNH